MNTFTDGDVIGTLRSIGGAVAVGLSRFLRLARLAARVSGGIAAIGWATVPTRSGWTPGTIVIDPSISDETVRWT